ncbi:MAG: hypothetical protein J6V15_04395 [Clostridia bacterium]|nr:hypothetical protein [Clostridia bacterium]
MSRYNRIARSLCAVMTAACAVIPRFWVQAEPVKDYKYSLSVEFGSLAFYYDHGIWDPDKMNYVADEASANPAQGTLDDYPGWYGFDGVANKIVVTNDYYEYTDSNGETKEDPTAYPLDVDLSLSYRQLTSDEIKDTNYEIVNGVSMEVLNGTLEGGADAPADWSADGGQYVTTLSRGQTAVALIQLSGTPTVTGDGGDQVRYDSGNTMDPIGMIELRIVDWAVPPQTQDSQAD